MSTNPLPARGRTLLLRLAAVGGLVLAAGAAIAPDRVWSNALLIAYYLLTLALGGAVFVALTYVSGAGWHVAFRRVPESLASLLPIAGVAMLGVLALGVSRYSWHHHGAGDAGVFWFKELWLTPLFWCVRAGVYVALWSLLARWLVARSRKQDEVGGLAITAGSTRISALFLALYAITFSLASIDWLMALEPMWFSTIWGVYQFSGMIQAALAAMIVFGLLLRGPGRPLCGVFNDEHLHDLGKLLLGFSCFWMYIWFSQYMLIWYSNLPEETSYFIGRTSGAWGAVTIASLVLNWGIPFFVLLPKPAKRSAGVMMKVAVVVLIGRWVDLYLMIFPSTIGELSETGVWRAAPPAFGVWEVAAIVGLISVTALLSFRAFPSHAPVPRKDPYLGESVHYHAG